MTKERLNRIILMAPIILRGGSRGVSLDELGRKFRVSREEILDDLAVLAGCSTAVPGEAPDDPYYCVRVDRYGDRVHLSNAAFFRRPMTITGEEALVLVVAGKALIRSGIFDEKGPLDKAMSKIEMLLKRSRARIPAGGDRIEVDILEHPGRWWGLIEEAFEKGLNLLIEYYSFSRDQRSEREVEPLTMITMYGHWYLVAWCHQAGDIRIFKLDRIAKAKITGNHSTRVLEGSFQIPQFVGEYRPGGRAQHVKLRFQGREGRRLLEEWPAARYREHRDGTITIEMWTMNLEWLSYSLLRFGDCFIVESPSCLAGLLESRAREVLDAYRK